MEKLKLPMTILFGLAIGFFMIELLFEMDPEKHDPTQVTLETEPPDIKNIARGKPAKQSSINYSNPDDAQGGVDGKITGRAGFHTKNELNAWWQVDLLRPQKLYRIKVFNRTDCCTERANKLNIQISMDEKNWRRVYKHVGEPIGGYKKGTPLDLDLGGKKARYVRLELKEKNYFHLDEVEIYGTSE